MSYQPLYIKSYETGLVQERVNFILPDDAFPVLENAFIWRERIKRKQGCELLGRLRRIYTAASIGVSVAGVWNFNLYTTVVPNITETNAEIEPGSLQIVIGVITLIDQGNGTLATAPPSANVGTINYITGAISITHGGGAVASTTTFNYFPGLPCMGLRSRELNNINFEQTIAFDTKYSYRFANGWQEFIPGTTWSGNDSDFFWSTNYWVGDGNQKIFWVTNFSGILGDPIRYTNGTLWANFSPQVNAGGTLLTQCMALLPFRGRLVALNTLEGANLATSVAFTNRIRWANIGNPFTVAVPGLVTTVVADAWRDDIRGKGGFLDIPTSEAITAVGFVRDNLVIYCERSTWQLRYTGRSIAPFQIERVNSELGAESTFSAVQFDTSLVGVGDKGIVECDSFKSDRIDVKIPDLVFQFNNDANGTKRVHGIRDFVQRIAYWIYPYKPTGSTFPNRRLIYNYENDSWAIYTDYLTCLGTYQPLASRRWSDFVGPAPNDTWEASNFPWIDRPSGLPAIVGGNQQGFVVFLDEQATNDISLSITSITGNTTTATLIGCKNHNLQTGSVIEISNIPVGTPFASSLNGQVFGIVKVNNDSFTIWKYSAVTGGFDTPQLDIPATYIGGGKIAIRDNFSIKSKKFNLLEDGQNIQIGFVDVLLNNTSDGAITLKVYNDYNDSESVNTLPDNVVQATNQPDAFFNFVIPTTVSIARGSSKNWQRVFCASRAAFITLEYTLSNAQMVGPEQASDVQIEAQILWMRRAGRQLPTGI